MAERPHEWQAKKTGKVVRRLFEAGELLRRSDGQFAVNNQLSRAIASKS